MRVSDDFDAAVFVNADEHLWLPSPTPGVERMILERIGDEDALATSFVRFAPRTQFPLHVHTLGEEFLVLDGDFNDTSGCYPAGRYLRHPPGSSHAPWSEGGCLLFVKLKQFAADDGAWVDRDLAALPRRAVVGASARCVLHRYRDERVEIVDADAGTVVRTPPLDQLTELLVLDGSVVVNGQRLERLGWARLPRAAPLTMRFAQESRLFLKSRSSAPQGRMNA